jgi:hypothetical protein
MPTFFDESNLTEAQKANWDFAITEYKRIQEANVAYRVAHLSDEEREFFRQQYGKTTDKEIGEEMRSFSRLISNSPGHPKSALFARLLSGKAALPHPPPTSFSYPWYDVIEGDGPHVVSVSPRVLDVAGGRKQLSINQCGWSVLAANDAAHILLDLGVELDAVRANAGSDGYPSLDPEKMSRIFLRLKNAYAAKPEFVVQHGQWPAYRLFVMQTSNPDRCQRCVRHYAQSAAGPGVLARIGSVFDLDLLRLNLRVGETLGYGVHPQKRLDETKARIAKHSGAQHPMAQLLDEQAVKAALANLEQDVRDYEADPEAFDWVELYLDQWHLAKT